MNEAILAIQQGALPIMHSVPNENIRYIDQIEILYNNILRIREGKKREEDQK